MRLLSSPHLSLLAGPPLHTHRSRRRPPSSRQRALDRCEKMSSLVLKDAKQKHVPTFATMTISDHDKMTANLKSAAAIVEAHFPAVERPRGDTSLPVRRRGDR